MTLLSLLVTLPFLAAVGLAFVPANYRFVMRLVALATTATVAALGLLLFLGFDTGAAGYQYVSILPGLGAESLGIRCRLGVDGISVGLVLLGALVAFGAACVSWEIRDREKLFYILLLVMTGGILGAFASLDLFFLYFFHELALVPTFIMIGVWGRGENRNYATFQITIYLSAGALIALIGLVGVYLQLPAAERTFDLEELAAWFRAHPMDPDAQRWIFPLLMFGFGILVSLWPFHSWAPLGYGAAPTATAMLHAGVLKKFGLYGLIRVALPFLPDGARPWLQVLALLALGNILYCGLVALRQRNLNLLIGNSSVAHMGFVFLGIASLSVIGITGAVLVMIAHGLLAALTFALSGYLYQQLNTLEMSRMGGLLQRLPFIGTALIMAMLAGCGLPGFANFPGEALVFFGAWKTFPVITLLAVWGALVIGGVYMLRAIRNLLHGPLAADCQSITDTPHAWRRLPFVLLLAALLAFGFFPAWLTDKIQPSVAQMLSKTSTAPIASRPADVATSTGFLGVSRPPHPDPLPRAEGTASGPPFAVRQRPVASMPLGGSLRRRIHAAEIVVHDARRSSLSRGERAGMRANPLSEVHPSMTSAGESVRPQWAFASEPLE